MPPMPAHDTDHSHEGSDHQHGHRTARTSTHGADDGQPRIGFIGAGTVGTALAVAFARAGWQVTAVASRDEDRRRRFQELVAGARALRRGACRARRRGPDLPDRARRRDRRRGRRPASCTAARRSSTRAARCRRRCSRRRWPRAQRWRASIRSSRSPTTTRPWPTCAARRSRSRATRSLLPLLAELAESIGARRDAARRRQGRVSRGGDDGRRRAGRPARRDRPGRACSPGSTSEPPIARLRAARPPGAGQRRATRHRRALTGPFVRGDVGHGADHLAVLRELAPSALPLYVEVARRELAIARRRGELRRKPPAR